MVMSLDGTSGWFRRIFYESVDKPEDGVEVFLKGLDQHYMLGRERNFLQVSLCLFKNRVSPC